MDGYVEGKFCVSPYTFEQVRGMPSKVRVRDVTLREGEDQPHIIFSLEEKVEIAELLSKAGVPELEVGYPSSGDVRETMRAIMSAGVPIKLSGMMKAYAKDWKKEIDMAINCGADSIRIGLYASPWIVRSKKKLMRSIEAETEGLLKQIDYGVEHGISIYAALIDTTRTDLHTIQEIYGKAADEGASRIWLYDTGGVATPPALRYLVVKIKEAVNLPLVVHCHNDFGLATANTIAAIESGAEYADLSINGYGDRAGNASLEEVVASLEILYGVDTGIDLAKLYSLSKRLEDISKVKCQPHKAIVGDNAFLESGEAHVHSLLQSIKSGRWDPGWDSVKAELFGRRREICWGLETLRRGEALNLKLEQMDMSLSKTQIKEIKNEIQKRGLLSDQEFEQLLRGYS
jgi:isopropylmalate/homocitrate/citramalate synthase